MGTFVNEFVNKIYNLPKTSTAVSEFLNSYYDEVLPNGKVVRRMMWERFEASYVKVTRHYVKGTDDNEGDIYLYAHKLISRCVLAEVAPYFESDGQLFAYFQLMVRNTRINNSVKAEKASFVLIGDLLKESDEDVDLENFEHKVIGVPKESNIDSFQSTDSILSMVDSLSTEEGEPDMELIMFGRLFVDNGFSFNGMYGLCGLDLDKFKEVKKRFIAEIKNHY